MQEERTEKKNHHFVTSNETVESGNDQIDC